MQNAEITIRRAAIGDAPACAEIHCLGWEAAYAELVPAEAMAERRLRRPAQWQANLSRDDHEVYVPVLDGQVVGFLSTRQPGDLENLPDCYCEVGGIYLHPSVYRQGIGRQLMLFAEEQARAKGKTALMLWVFEDNAPSRRFYEACGYHPDGAAEEHDYGRTLRCLRYVKEI
ncbi:MAG: GNAT family N-acetyltransferase [Oscillospiraceae bacterium]|jgi:GNAT superfamily N-acetyltransferase|nr:GNAT family N-acetyltransferase [Oscillospiraceae bacterium]